MPEQFQISETVRNISRFEDDEQYSTAIEERFWRIDFCRNDDYLGLYLKCEKEECEWSIEVEFTLKLVSQNGNCLMKSWKDTFEKTEALGFDKFVSWKDLESDYVVDDSVVVETHVRIVKETESPCIEYKNQKTFLLNHTVKNVSRIIDGSDYFTKIENRFNIPWQLKIQRRNGFFGIFLHCNKEMSNRSNWTIAVDFTLKLVSTNGQCLTSNMTSVFNEPDGYGLFKFIRWDDMEEKYLVNDSIGVEARVKIIKMTGCNDIEDLENKFYNCVIS
ncbi:MATH domain-containing protein [Caenorhabditis elegans]|uniref:MATH domain-containing protein n=1 Tax=Caenorhabditis elegans TaxID=6239 RepID=O16560_CAEEL|nr:MATH domain-containing protein [Caenorhabditis elegans]CCD64674.1 MATH domain-containing protein [Caenorhabditis elegans]|eukprot:NP_494110.1 MATH (meprin-associated Traf homology) domain containing [Caenorhabditis elegans]